MIKLAWTILCENATVDSQTNNLSVFNLLEELKVNAEIKEAKTNKEIVIPLRQKLVTYWKNSTTEQLDNLNIKAQIIDPTNTVLQEMPMRLNLPAGKRNIRAIFEINGLKLTESGVYTFAVFLEKNKSFERVGETELIVNLDKKYVLESTITPSWQAPKPMI